MIQNLKIDIIYYDTPSDFEFEFNLGGCCHSRVLNSKTSSPKEMISCLSKAVSRSRVILIIGKLDGSDGLYSLISKAISLPLSEVNAEEYGIAPGTDTTVIANSLPLISTDGLLAGCIIESGPQSIILLPEAKSLRKDIAENLIFQYITAVSRTPDTETVITSDSADNEEVADIEPDAVPMVEEEPITEETITEELAEAETSQEENETETEIFAEETVVSEQEEDNDDTVISETVTNVFENEEEQIFDIYTEDNNEESVDIDNNYVYNSHTDSDTDEEYDEYEEDYEDDKNTKSGINTLIWIILGLMFIIAAVLVYMLVYTPLKNGTDVIQYISQVLNI